MLKSLLSIAIINWQVTCYLKSCLLTEAYMDFYVCLPLSVRSPYDCSVWKSFYILVLQEDLYYPHPFVQDVLWATLHKFVEPVMLHWPGCKLREKALETVMQHVHYEDENTQYICIASVNKVNWGLWLLVEPLQKKKWTLLLSYSYWKHQKNFVASQANVLATLV